MLDKRRPEFDEVETLLLGSIVEMAGNLRAARNDLNAAGKHVCWRKASVSQSALRKLQRVGRQLRRYGGRLRRRIASRGSSYRGVYRPAAARYFSGASRIMYSGKPAAFEPSSLRKFAPPPRFRPKGICVPPVASS